MGKSLYSAEKDMEERVRRIEELVNRIQDREDKKYDLITFPVDLWLESGYEEGGVLIINEDANLRISVANVLRSRGYKVVDVSDGQGALSALRKSTFSVMVVPWVIFEKSGDFVNVLRKAFPQTKIVITSSRFAWSNEDISASLEGRSALDAGAYSYVPDKHILKTVPICVESAIKSVEKSCPVLIAGLPCNLRCML